MLRYGARETLQAEELMRVATEDRLDFLLREDRSIGGVLRVAADELGPLLKLDEGGGRLENLNRLLLSKNSVVELHFASASISLSAGRIVWMR